MSTAAPWRVHSAGASRLESGLTLLLPQHFKKRKTSFEEFELGSSGAGYGQSLAVFCARVANAERLSIVREPAGDLL